MAMGGKNCKFTLISANKMHLAITEVKTHVCAGSGNKDAEWSVVLCFYIINCVYGYV